MDTSYWTTAKRTEIVAYFRGKLGYDLDLILPSPADIVAAGNPPPLGGDRSPIAGLPLAAANLQMSPTSPMKTYLRLGQRIYIRDYQGNDVGNEDGKCPFPRFVDCVVRDLRIIADTVVGRRLLHSLEANGGASRLTIVFGHGMPPNTSQCNATGGATQPLAGGVPSAPVSCEVMYNPLYYGLPVIRGLNDTLAEVQRNAWGHPAQKPADSTLLHELIHAEDMLRGIFNDVELTRGKERVKLSEMRCVGLDLFDNESIVTENAYREDRGLSKRLFYRDRGEITKSGPAMTPAYQELLTYLDRRLMTHSDFVSATKRTFGKRDKILSVEDALWEFNRSYAWIEDPEEQLPGLITLLQAVIDYKEKDKAKRSVQALLDAIGGRVRPAIEGLLAQPVSPAVFDKVRRMGLLLEQARIAAGGKKLSISGSLQVTYTDRFNTQSTDFSPRAVVEGYQRRLSGPNIGTLQGNDITALQTLSADNTAAAITRQVAAEVLGIAQSGQVTIQDTGAGSSAGRNPNGVGYIVVYGQWNWDDIRISTLVHELTHVANIRAYDATPLMLSYPVTTAEDALRALLGQRKREMEALVALANDPTSGFSPYQRYWLTDGQNGKLPYAIGVPNALSLDNLKRAPGGSQGLYDMHAELAVSGVLTQAAFEYETVLNQCLVLLHMWGIPQTHPFHARVIALAQAAYTDRQQALALRQAPPPLPVLPPPRRLERSTSVSSGLGGGGDRPTRPRSSSTRGNRLL